MKKHTLLVAGVVNIDPYGRLKVDDVDMQEKIAELFGLNLDDFQIKQFAGTVEITINDLTEPLVIETSEDKEEER